MPETTPQAQYSARVNQTLRQVYDSIQGIDKQTTDELRRKFIAQLAKLACCSEKTVRAWLYNSDQQPNAIRKKTIAEFLQANVDHLFPTPDIT